MAQRRQPKPGSGHFHGSGHYTRQIIKRLEKVHTLSGYHAAQIYADWIQLLDACLAALPTHLISLAQTGHLAEDTPETKQLFEQLRGRYQPPPDRSPSSDVWPYFSEAFALLLESAEPGLWGPGSYATFEAGSLGGPDVLGQVFMEFTHPSPHTGQYLTPWPVVLLMSRLNSGGKELVYDRLKQACQHPDNILAQAILLAGLAIEEPQQAREWFMTRVVPAAMPYFEIVKVSDPCVGSGRMLLGMASQFEPWMVQLGLVQFFGQDIDPLMACQARINCRLYGLNYYALKLAEAVHELQAAQQPDKSSLPLTLPKSPQTALAQVAPLYGSTESQAQLASPTFEVLFRAANPASE